MNHDAPHRSSQGCRRLSLAAAAAVTLLTLPAGAATNDILFVGNSFTHGNYQPVYSFNNTNVTDENGTSMGGIPGIFKEMTTSVGLSYNVSIEAVSSQTLAYHYANKSAIIGQAKWGTVVLQENSTVPISTSKGGSPSSFFTAAQQLKTLIASNNAATNTLLYETWASPTSVTNQGYDAGTTGLQEMTNDLQSNYFKAYYADGFTGVTRVGDAFMAAVNNGSADANPADGITPGTFDLWGDDARHPSIYGAYLSAAMFYQKITGQDPRQLSTTAANSAALMLGISSTYATTLDNLAYQINTAALPANTTPVVTKLAITSATYSGAASNYSPPNITGSASVTSITTAEGTFSNLVGATANNVTSGNQPSSVGTAGTKNAVASGLTANDGDNNLTAGNFQFTGTGAFNANTRFFIIESAPVSGTPGDDTTVTLVDANNAVVGSYTLQLLAADFTTSAANTANTALATLTYTDAVASLTSSSSKLGGVSFSLADLGVTDYSLIAGVTGLHLSSSTLDPNVVGMYVVPEPGSITVLGVGGLLLMRRRRR